MLPAFVVGAAVLVITAEGDTARPPPTELAVLAQAASGSGAPRFVAGVAPPRSVALPIRPLDPRPARPASLSIPAAGIYEEIVEVAAADDGIRVPPPSKVGWYRSGPRPGEGGRAIVIGHLDSLDGPAAFTTLVTAEQGDEIAILDREGVQHDYEVTGMLDVAKTAFPADRVYGSGNRSELVLITCGGRFDPESGYEDNLIVFAKAA